MPEHLPIADLERQYNQAFRRLIHHDPTAKDELKRIREEFSSRRGEVAAYVNQLPDAEKLILAKRRWVEEYSSGAGTPPPPVTRKPSLEQMLYTLVTTSEASEENTTRRKNVLQTQFPIFPDRLEAVNAFVAAMLADKADPAEKGHLLGEIGEALQAFEVKKEDGSLGLISEIKYAMTSLQKKALPSLALRVAHQKENEKARAEGKRKRYLMMELNEQEIKTWEAIQQWYFTKFNPDVLVKDQGNTPVKKIMDAYMFVLEDFYKANKPILTQAFVNQRAIYERNRQIVMESGITHPLAPLAAEEDTAPPLDSDENVN